MTEVRFYHLTGAPLEQTLPRLLATSLGRGWRVLVHGANPERLAFLDTLLWTRPEDGFLPHGLEGQGNEAEQPVLLSGSGDNANAANVLMLIDGAPLDPAGMAAFDTVALLFDGNDPDAVQQARQNWKTVAQSDLDAVYWAQDERGNWTKKATS